MFFVIHIDENGVPNTMKGPWEWDECADYIMQYVAANEDGIDIADFEEVIKGDGYFATDHENGGIFIVSPDED